MLYEVITEELRPAGGSPAELHPGKGGRDPGGLIPLVEIFLDLSAAGLVRHCLVRGHAAGSGKEANLVCGAVTVLVRTAARTLESCRITSYNVCYTKLLRLAIVGHSSSRTFRLFDSSQTGTSNVLWFAFGTWINGLPTNDSRSE